MNTASLKNFIQNFNEPCVFKNKLKPTTLEGSKNSACTWTPELVGSLFKGKKLNFRIGKKNEPNSKLFNIKI